MAHIYSHLLLFLFPSFVFAQNYAVIDSITDLYPKDIHNSTQLAALINRDFSNPEEKARAIFRWVASNIRYDVAQTIGRDGKSTNAFSYTTENEKNSKEQKFKSDVIQQTYKTRAAICHGYSILIEDLGLKCALDTKVIVGTLKSSPEQIGQIPKEVNHAWNAVKINGKWQFIDATLAAGFISAKTNAFKFYYNDSYFFSPAERFFLNHFPEDEKWLMVKKTKSDFAQLPLFFGYYFQYNYDLKQPISGLHSVKSGNFIFTIDRITDDDTIEYSIDTDNKKNYVEPDIISKEFKVDTSNIKGNYLSIFVNGKIIAIYKILS